MNPAYHKSPLRIVLIISITIFIVESGIMLIFHIFFPSLPVWTELLLDPITLVLFLLPALYIFIVGPLEKEIGIRLRFESELLEARSNLEQKIQERTAQLDQRNQQSILHSQLGELLQTCNTKEEACRVVARVAAQMFPHISGALYIYSPSRNDLDLLTSWGISTSVEPVMIPNECWALRRGRAHREENPEAGAMCLSCHDKVGFNTLCLPMMGQGETMGVLQLRKEQHQTPGFGELDEQMAAAMAEQVALTLANLNLRETLRHQAIRDALTGLFNRRYLEETLDREIQRAQRKNTPLGIFMLDIDHFKRFNDTFGHEAGDTLLQEFGAYLQSQVRADDVACRYGGEEFTIVLPETNREIACERAEQLRKGLHQLEVRHHGNLLGKVSISIGVALYPTDAMTGDVLLQTADKALYRAKNEGRDRVAMAGNLADSFADNQGTGNDES